jgi:hypothetical protein
MTPVPYVHVTPGTLHGVPAVVDVSVSGQCGSLMVSSAPESSGLGLQPQFVWEGQAGCGVWPKAQLSRQ